MPERYAPVSQGKKVFRTTRFGGGLLPAGHQLPKPEWLEPTKDDIADAEQSGRPPGLSVWARPEATHDAACWLRRLEPAEQRSFVANVGGMLAIAEKHKRAFAVVSDPLEHPTDTTDERWAAVATEARIPVCTTCDAHSLAEGIRKPEGVTKIEHRSFREELASQFEPMGS